MTHDPKTYKAVKLTLDRLFKEHGEKAGTAIRRYIRIRSETKSAKKQINQLEAEIKNLRNKGR